MATGHAAWLMKLAMHREVGIRRENDENVASVSHGVLEAMVQETHVLVRWQPRRQIRISLRDITHLFPGSENIASLDEKTGRSPPTQQAQGNEMARRSLPSVSSQNSRKRRKRELSSEIATVRRVLPKFR